MAQPRDEWLSDAEMRQRVAELRDLQQPCALCPRQCKVDRAVQLGYCQQPMDLMVAAACAHRGEEPALSGSGGAGTVF